MAIPDHLTAIEALRRALPPGIHVWLNRRHGARPLAPDDLRRALAVDPFYRDRPVPSHGRPCGAGSRAIVVDGRGEARRCLALPARLGNLYADEPWAIIGREPAPCPAQVCRCHLGQVHLDPTLAARYGNGLLAREPAPSR